MSTILNKAKNYIINGSFDFWQRGFNFISPIGYCADRFSFSSLVPANYKITRSPDVPSYQDSQYIFRYSHVISTLTPTTTLSPTEATTLTHKIEGVYARFLYRKKVTLSFWIMATQSGVYPIAFKNAGGGVNMPVGAGDFGARSYVTTFEIKNINVWERKVITLTLEDGSTGADLGFSINWSLATGTSFHSPSLNQWVNGNYLSHGSCVNGIGSAGNFTLAGIQLEEGDSASKFELAGGNYINELQLCQRYFEKSHLIDRPPGTGGNVNVYVRVPIGHSYGGFKGMHTIPFSVRKRTYSVIKLYSTNGTVGYITEFEHISNSLGQGIERQAYASGGETSFSVTLAAYNYGYVIEYGWTADAEL